MKGETFLYAGFDWLSSIGMALAAWIAASRLPGEWNEWTRMILGMLLGMAAGNLLAFLLSIPLGMFEMMYLGGWSGMAAGMLGAMDPGAPVVPGGLLAALTAGTLVWAVHYFLNRLYRQRRRS